MTDQHQPQPTADEDDAGPDLAVNPASNEAGVTESPVATEGAATADESAPAEDTAQPADTPPTETTMDGAGANVDEYTAGVADAAGDGPRKKRNIAMLVGGIAGAVVLTLALVTLAAFVWPGFLAGPGKPDGKAAAVVSALASKNPAEVDKVTCHMNDGKSVTSIPPQALQMISSAKQAGATQLTLDTEAIAPVDLTLSQQGQTQSVQAEAVLGVTNGSWCLKGLSQRGQ